MLNNAYQEEGPIDQIIDCLLDMLEKDVVDNSKSCAEYFEFFRNYSSSVSVACNISHSYYGSIDTCTSAC